MGFFSFGKKKKGDTPAPSAPATTRISKDKKPAMLVNSASAASTLSNASSGSSSYSPPRTSQQQQQQQAPVARRTNTSPVARNSGHYRHSSALAPPPPIPALSGHARLSGSSSTSNLRHNPVNLSSSNTSLALPNAPYASGNLAKKGSSATLNSVHSAGGTPLKRGPHDPPARAVGLGSASSSSGSLNNPFNKQRAASYGYGVRNIWTTGTGPRSIDGHQYSGMHPAVFAGKHASTGSPGMLANGSSYINGASLRSTDSPYLNPLSPK
ncbi:hypothetical protein PIIN_01461 [Serendipita indica DSM 11827]|uniref:Uncharacterized protein n=1 Tax=Serendipita indica (strain DSM 11827) TaxID=1109443 RepID=G4T8I5_SERID|nr:hypothetical protein PIIN_01461 [Serendipita indica DSM 11827]